MKSSGFIVFASLAVTGLATSRAADATTPVDYTQRNSPYAPSATVSPDKKTPETNTTVQDKRVDKTTVNKKPATVGERRAPIDLKETKDKTVRDKDSHRPEKIEEPMSGLNHRDAPMSTSENTKQLQMVTKYQESLNASSAIKTSRTPALSRTTETKVNRFVFRKNAPDTTSGAALEGTSVTPAAGGAPVLKK
jgi:hypothetical protein